MQTTSEKNELCRLRGRTATIQKIVIDGADLMIIDPQVPMAKPQFNLSYSTNFQLIFSPTTHIEPSRTRFVAKTQSIRMSKKYTQCSSPLPLRFVASFANCLQQADRKYIFKVMFTDYWRYECSL